MKTGKRFFIALYAITTVLFFLYLALFSDNNFSKHRDLNRQIDNLESKILKTKNQINNTYRMEDLLKNPNLLEQYAREQMGMHKKNEDVFIIVYE